MPPGVPCLSWWGSRSPVEALWPDPMLGEGQALPLLPLAIWVQEGSGSHCSPPASVCPHCAQALLGHIVALLDFCMRAGKGRREGLGGSLSSALMPRCAPKNCQD